MSKLNFDATTVAPQQPIEAIPAGWYKAAMSESELKPTSDGTGTRLATEFTILEGPFKGRKVFDGFNLENKNPQVVAIAQQQLSALCHATGVLRVQDSTQLHNIPVGIKISLDARRTVDALNNEINPQTKQPYVEGTAGTKTYEAQNRIKSYKNANEVTTNADPAAGEPAGAAAPTWAKPAVAAPTPAPVASITPPWEQSKSTAAPVSAPVTPETIVESAAKKGPKGPRKPKTEASKVERKFFVYFADDNMPLMTETEVVASFAKGMPAETPLLIEADIDSGNWKDAAEYNIAICAAAKPVVPPASVAAPVASNVPPWERK